MQMPMLVTAITLSTGVGFFTLYEVAVTETNAQYASQIEIIESQAEVITRALRREIQIDASDFEIPSSGTLVISDDALEDVVFSGITLSDLLSYTIDSTGTVSAVIDADLYDRNAGTVIAQDNDQGGEDEEEKEASSSSQADASTDQSFVSDWSEQVLDLIATGDAVQIRLGQLSPADLALLLPEETSDPDWAAYSLPAAWEN